MYRKEYQVGAAKFLAYMCDTEHFQTHVGDYFPDDTAKAAFVALQVRSLLLMTICGAPHLPTTHSALSCAGCRTRSSVRLWQSAWWSERTCGR